MLRNKLNSLFGSSNKDSSDQSKSKAESKMSFEDFLIATKNNQYEDDMNACQAIQNLPNMSSESYDDAFSRCYNSWQNPRPTK